MPESKAALNIHATCVAFDGKGVLITGKSGSGKSALALQLMALGAELVADDRTDLCPVHDQVLASAPAGLLGLIEARGVGILTADSVGPVPLVLVVDMDKAEDQRLPVVHWVDLCDQRLVCLHKIEGAYFPAAILQYLKSGRRKTR